MNLFLSPESTFTTGLRWSESLKTFVRCDQKESSHAFEIATPTEEQLHAHHGALQGIPARGSALDYSELHELIWGSKNRPGLVKKVLPEPKGTRHLVLTQAIARLVREELGLVTRLSEVPEPDAKPGLDAEGNSASPSSSGSAS